MLLQRFARTSLLIVSISLLTGCYLTPPDSAHPHDPLQHFNRDTTRLNSKLDRWLVKPVAKEYREVTPYVVRKSVTNFFDNLGKPAAVGNDLLQGHVRWALNDFWSFLVNTTVGLGGIFTPAEHIGLKTHDNDFGLTLNHYHVYTAYFVLPFAGPHTLGSSTAIISDYYMGVTQYFVPFRYDVILTMVDGLNSRANLLSTEKTAGSMVLDKYTFYRSAYLQFRANQNLINQTPPLYTHEQVPLEAIGDDDQGAPLEPIN